MVRHMKRRYICTETLAILPEASWCFEEQLLGVGSPPATRGSETIVTSKKGVEWDNDEIFTKTTGSFARESD